MKIARGLFVVAAAFLVVVAIGYAIASSNRARANAECERNLRQLAAVLQNYAQNEGRDRYPPLSSVPGHLTFSASHISTTGPKADTDPGKAVDDTKYWYLGWMIPNERSGLEWIEQYRKHAPAIDSIPTQYGIWPDYEDDIAARQRALDTESHDAWYKDHLDGKLRPGEKAWRPTAGPLLEEMRFYRPLREGEERFLMIDIGNPAGSPQLQAQIPVLIERPELHGDGGHVLYMDGHVEFVPYPGKFPMVPSFIEGLRSLDALEK